MILAAQALLDRNPDPTEADVRHALSGNICRCTGYVKIVEAVMAAAAAMRAGGDSATTPGMRPAPGATGVA
jgi:carbon-monoxide dehydrogenase small subunit